ncbi:MAG: hypothetical protein Q9191_003528 [Dirinaria sp. TL-2023a]
MSRDILESNLHTAKRQKRTNGASDQPRVSRIFAPFRITTSVGRSLQTYDLRKGLNLVFLTRPQTPSEITASCAWRDRVLAAWGGEVQGSHVGVWAFKRGRKVAELEMPKRSNESIRKLLVFGAWTVGCCSTSIEVWKSATCEHYTTITPRGSSGAPLPGEVCNMPTMLNKLLVGKNDGTVEMWNVSTGKLVYTFQSSDHSSGPVTALQPTPALSLLAIARSDGSIVIQDVRADKILIQLNSKKARKAAITSISFRTDGLGAGRDGQKDGIMATAGPDDGDVTLWDLNEGGRISGTLRGAHNPASSIRGGVSGGVSKVEFLPGQAVMMTSGLDNALKSWIFDGKSLTTVPRILHSRSGHAAPVTALGFMPTNSDGADASGKWLLSAARDQSLWGWSLRRDGQSTELSQGSIRKKAKKLGALAKNLDLDDSLNLEDLKAPEITCFACSLNRDGGMGVSSGGGGVWTNAASKKGSNPPDSAATSWESIVTGHRGDRYARTWSWGRKKAGRWAFETGDGAEVTSVAVTSCGTFALVGSAAGSISTYNLQSGIQRQKFPAVLTPAQRKKLKTHAVENKSDGSADRYQNYGPGEGKHVKAVTGLMVDPLNRKLISCGLDGKLKFWNFETGQLQDQIDWSPMSAIMASRYYKQSDLIALSCDDLSIRVIDTETRKLVRELWGCLGQISDFVFSNDGRWIIAASMDSVIRVWDLPTGHLVNAFRVGSPCTAVAFSDTGEYLATAHADSVGINIWNNRTLFTHVPTRLLHEGEVIDAQAPTASGENGQGMIDAAFEEEEDDDIEDRQTAIELQSPSEQLSRDLESLSLVPRSRWQTLLHLDIIRQRNKPKQPPKPPEKAPFFLPSLEGAQPTPLLDSRKEESKVSPAERSRILKLDRTTTESKFTTLLRTANENSEYAAFIDYFKSLPPSAADIEIRSLTPLEFVPFVSALTWRLQERRDYELIQAWMSVFLKIHGESVPGDARVVEALRKWRTVQGEESRRLGELVGYCGGVVSFLRSSRV